MNINAKTNLPSLIALVCLALHAVPATGQLVMSTSPASAPAGSSGGFDVTLTDVSGSFNVAGFTFDLAAGTGVSFTNADMNTGGVYIFNGNSLDASFSVPFTTNSFPTNEVDASDVALTGSTTVNTGDTYDLGHIYYAVAPGAAPGPVSLDFLNIGSGTSLSDENANPIPFSVANGSIDVEAPGTPEPGPCALLGGFGMVAISLIRRRRRVR